MPRLRQKAIRSNELKKIALAAIILLSLIRGSTLSGSASALAAQSDLSELPLTFPVQSPPIVAYFNQIARPQDIASFPPVAFHLVPQVTAGQKMVGFFSWAEAEDKLEELVDQVDIVTYNPEHWEYTPTDEQENLVETVQRAAEFAHTRGLRFMFAPDRRFAEAHLGEVAPYVDAVLLQGQRIQHDPPAFASWVLPMISIARSANPEIQVYVQVGATRGTALEMFTAIQTVANDIDGIAVWSMPRTLDILQEFVTLLQGRPAAFAPTPPPSTTGSPATTVPTLASAPSSTRIPTSQSSMAIDTPHLVTAQTSPVAIVVQTQVPSEISTATLTPTLTALRASQSSGAAATADKINSISTPTATVAEEALLAQVTPLKVAAESLLPTTAPPLLSLAPEFEQAVETCDWLENSSSILVGVIIGLAAGMAGGVLLGFGLGRKQGGEKFS